MDMRGPRASLVTALLLPACSEPAPTGTLAFSDALTGGLTVVDVATGERRSIATEAGPPGAIALSPEADQIAFSIEPQQWARKVFVADRTTGAVREVRPETGEMSPYFIWGTGGWFFYTSSGGSPGVLIVERGATVGRVVGQYAPWPLVPSPTEPSFAYSDCLTPPVLDVCPRELILESPSGADRRVLASGAMLLEPAAFTPDGGSLLVYEEVAGETHLVVYDVDDVAAARRDLGPVEHYAPSFHEQVGAAAMISADGKEALALRDGALVALALDGSGSRVVHPDGDGRIAHAAFAPSGQVVYVVEVNLNPGSDDIESAQHLYVEHDGARRALLRDAPGCWRAPAISPKGGLVAWSCGEGLVVYALDHDFALRLHDDADVLGFDGNGGGLIVADGATLARIDLDGDVTSFGEHASQFVGSAYVNTPAFDYVP